MVFADFFTLTTIDRDFWPYFFPNTLDYDFVPDFWPNFYAFTIEYDF